MSATPCPQGDPKPRAQLWEGAYPRVLGPVELPDFESSSVRHRGERGKRRCRLLWGEVPLLGSPLMDTWDLASQVLGN